MYWFNDVEFVFFVFVWESKVSVVGDDDKVYYFFMECVIEEGFGSFIQSCSSYCVVCVVCVCKGDLGGKKILQKKWIFFLKVCFICYILLYEILCGVCSLDVEILSCIYFYVVFMLSIQWKILEVLVICCYDLVEIQVVFVGFYMEYQDGFWCWGCYEGGVFEFWFGLCIIDLLCS